MIHLPWPFRKDSNWGFSAEALGLFAVHSLTEYVSKVSVAYPQNLYILGNRLSVFSRHADCRDLERMTRDKGGGTRDKGQGWRYEVQWVIGLT
ncbi:MAG TPA: hypothetical protein DCR93_31390 [Cytophagales bacterium]|nr:hypothetical protein [Cytophagales bacterium]HAP63807.1 hypothetical protein [Cytophagales bacterium]